MLANEVEGETGGRLQGLAVEAHVSFLECVADSPERRRAPEVRPRSWLARFRAQPHPLQAEAGEWPRKDDLITRVDEVIGNPIRQLLVQRGRAHAAITELALALGDLERRAT
jgi:hypothetical protein